MHRLAVVAVVALAVIGIGGCGSKSSSSSKSASNGKKVEAYDFRFEPTTLNVAVGAKVTLALKNEGKNEHNFSIDSLSVSKDIEKGESGTITFTAPNSPGDVQFYCKYHKARGMTGTLHVTM